MRAVGYARVSSSLQRERDTIASQLRVIPEFIQRQGWTLVKPIYVDDGRTAKAGHLDARTGFAALLKDAALGLFDVVVVVDVDRLTRAEDIAERGAILGAFQRANVKLASAASGQVLDLSTSTGDLFTTLHAFFAAEWTRKHRERVMQGRITAVKRGRAPAGRRPYWLKTDKETGKLVHDEYRADLVRELYRRVADGESCRAVADDFFRRGEPPPLTPWNRNVAQRMVRSRTALGQWLVDRRRNLTVDVEPLIDEDLWQRAQQAMDRSKNRGLRKTRHEYLLEGLGICGACGAPMHIRSAVWDPRRNGRWNPAAYQCRDRRIVRLGETGCRAPVVPTADADARAWQAICVELEDPALADRIMGEIAGRNDEAEQWQRDIAGYRDRLTKLERIEAGVLDRYRKGLISDNALDVELGRLSREREAFKTQVATAEKAKSALGDVASRLDDARRTLADLRAALGEADFATRRKLVELLVPVGGIVFDGNRLKITMLVPRTGAGLVRRTVNNTHHESVLKVRVVA